MVVDNYKIVDEYFSLITYDNFRRYGGMYLKHDGTKYQVPPWVATWWDAERYVLHFRNKAEEKND